MYTSIHHLRRPFARYQGWYIGQASVANKRISGTFRPHLDIDLILHLIPFKMTTPSNSTYQSPNETLTDVTTPAQATTLDIKNGLPRELGGGGGGSRNDEVHKHPFEGISNARRGLLMAIFALATALDVVNVSALVTATASIAEDLKLEAGNITWV